MYLWPYGMFYYFSIIELSLPGTKIILSIYLDFKNKSFETTMIFKEEGQSTTTNNYNIRWKLHVRICEVEIQCDVCCSYPCSLFMKYKKKNVATNEKFDDLVWTQHETNTDNADNIKNFISI